MKRALLLGLLVGISAAVMSLGAQQAPGGGREGGQGRGRGPGFPPVSAPEKVADNLYMIPGQGGNTAAFITSDGVVIVDTKLANNGQAILDQLKTVTDKPVTHIINTHTHGDHTGSNDFFPASVDIVTQENTAANMKKMPAFQEESKKHGLPDRTFKDKMTILKGKDAIDLYYFGAAHTNGDAFVVFRNIRVMHAGDVFANKGQRDDPESHCEHQERGHRHHRAQHRDEMAGPGGLRRVQQAVPGTREGVASRTQDGRTGDGRLQAA
jgi:hypothetical protein